MHVTEVVPLATPRSTKRNQLSERGKCKAFWHCAHRPSAHIGMIKRREKLTLYTCFLRGTGCMSVSGAVSCGREREWSMTQCMAINTHKPLSHALVSSLAHGNSPDYPQGWADMAGKHPLPSPRNAIKADQVYYTSMQACMPLDMASLSCFNSKPLSLQYIPVCISPCHHHTTHCSRSPLV